MLATQSIIRFAHSDGSTPDHCGDGNLVGKSRLSIGVALGQTNT